MSGHYNVRYHTKVADLFSSLTLIATKRGQNYLATKMGGIH